MSCDKEVATVKIQKCLESVGYIKEQSPSDGRCGGKSQTTIDALANHDQLTARHSQGRSRNSHEISDAVRMTPLLRPS